MRIDSCIQKRNLIIVHREEKVVWTQPFLETGGEGVSPERIRGKFVIKHWRINVQTTTKGSIVPVLIKVHATLWH